MPTSPPIPGPQRGDAEWSALAAGPGSLRVHLVLQELERVRRSLAQRVLAGPGVFPGYDRLRIQPGFGDLDGLVTFTAEVTEVRPTAHVVELVASLQPTVAGSADHEIARGTGLTLHLPASDPAAANPARSAHVALHQRPAR
jgi:hypothetical protein